MDYTLEECVKPREAMTVETMETLRSIARLASADPGAVLDLARAAACDEGIVDIAQLSESEALSVIETIRICAVDHRRNADRLLYEMLT